jgi:Ca2+-binding RTX toxin-like protein
MSGQFAADGLLTYEGALEQLKAFSAKLDDSDYISARTTEDLIGELKAIVNGTSGLVDGAGPDTTYLLWTGDGANGLVNDIQKAQPGKYVREFDCHVGKLLKEGNVFNNVLYDLIAAKEGHGGIVEKMNFYLGGVTDNSRTPEGIKNSFFNIVSEKFVSQADGDFRIVLGVDVDVKNLNNTYLWQTELSALYAKSGSFTVDGIPIDRLKSNINGLEAFKSATYLNADFINKLAASDLDGWLEISTEEKIIKRIEEINALPDNHPGKAILAYHTSGVEQFLDAHPLPSTFGKVLNKLGPVGIALGLIVVSTQAGAAELSGDREGAINIIEDWAVDASGSWAGEITGGLLGSLAIGVAVAAGVTISAPVAGAIILGASFLGGIWGADGATTAWEIWKNHDDDSRLTLMQKYAELFFGGPDKLLSELPAILAAQQGRTELIHPALDQIDIAFHAQDDIAWRYALKELNPFVISGIDYSAFNENGELDLYDPASNPEGMTSEYIEMRAQMLYWRLQYDQRGQDLNEQFDSDAPGNWDFIDKRLKNFAEAPDLHLEIDGAGVTVYDHQVVFGSDKDEELEGSGASDWLFGGAGNDTLTGNGDNDYLEGGAGADTYQVGAGHDTILDADGQGKVLFGSTLLDGGANVQGGWLSRDGKYTYAMSGNDLLIKSVSTTANTVTIKDFENGDLGILLGNRLTTDPARVDRVFGSSGNDIINSLDEDDVIIANDGDDIIHAGTGNDLIWGEWGNDILHGEHGLDYLDGETGNDQIYGGDGADLIECRFPPSRVAETAKRWRDDTSDNRVLGLILPPLASRLDSSSSASAARVR